MSLRQAFLCGVLVGAGIAVLAMTVAGDARSGEISAGPAALWGRGAPEHGMATDIRLRATRAPLSVYGEALAGREIAVVGVGSSWRFNWRRAYVEPAVGVGVHIGDGRRDFGSLGLFHLSGAIGYLVTDRLAVEVVVQHWSNGFLAKPDRGLNVVGARLAWRL